MSKYPWGTVSCDVAPKHFSRPSPIKVSTKFD